MCRVLTAGDNPDRIRTLFRSFEEAPYTQPLPIANGTSLSGLHHPYLLARLVWRNVLLWGLLIALVTVTHWVS